MFSEQQIKVFTERMREAASIRDTQTSHAAMDGVMASIAIASGCKEAAEIFSMAHKYYR